MGNSVNKCVKEITTFSLLDCAGTIITGSARIATCADLNNALVDESAARIAGDAATLASALAADKDYVDCSGTAITDGAALATCADLDNALVDESAARIAGDADVLSAAIAADKDYVDCSGTAIADGAALATCADLTDAISNLPILPEDFLQFGTGAVERTYLEKVRESLTPQDFGAVGDGIADDTAALQTALQESAIRHAKLNLNGKTYKLTNNLQLKAHQHQIEGQGATLKFIGAFGVKVSGSGTGAPYLNRTYIMSDIILSGDNKTSDGIVLDTLTEAGTSHILFDSVVINGFIKGFTSKNNSYNTGLLNSRIFNCTDGFVVENGANSGERVYAQNCTFFNCANDLVRNENTNGAIHLINCSLDYPSLSTGRWINVEYGKIFAIGCHFETGNYQIPVFKVSSQNGAYLNVSDSWINSTAGATVAATSLILCDNTADFKNNFYSCGTGSSGKMYTGAGIVRFNGYSSYNTSNSPLLSGDNSNLMADGGFEQASIVDNIFIFTDTAAITNRYAGANINLSLSTAQFNSGTKSLKATKTFGAGSNAAFAIACEIDEHKLVGLSGKVLHTGSGNLFTTVSHAMLEIDANGIPVVKRSSSLGGQTISPTGSWQNFFRGQPAVVAPSWATHFIIIFNMNSIATGDIFFDDIILTQM